MAVTKAKKAEQLAALEALLKEAKSVGFTSNQKITVSEVTDMRRELLAQNAKFLIAKKTLMRIAFKNALGLELDIDTLPGQVAMIIAKDDAVAPLGIANKFAKQKEWKKAEKMTFVGGYFEEKLVDADTITKIASLPSRDTLLAKMLGSMMSPLSGLARFFDGAKSDLEAKSLEKVSDLTVEAPAKEEAKEEAPKAETKTEKAPKAEKEEKKEDAPAKEEVKADEKKEAPAKKEEKKEEPKDEKAEKEEKPEEKKQEK
ncbi:50S ribosomal protein L10 [Candidatus Gracilibacteria bacterium]|nr:MAG: 50S ribosomal protein L10 [Candidatus Gracilibacteria bacterium]